MTVMTSYPSRLLLVALLASLSACAGNASRAPIESRERTGAGATAANVGTAPAVPAGAQTPATPLPDRTPFVAEPLEANGEGEIGTAVDEATQEAQVALAAPAGSRSQATQSLLAAAMQAATSGDWDRAQAALERAVKLDPEDAELWRQLAYTHWRQDNPTQALETARRALSLPQDATQRARTWSLIAEIETARGNATAAAAARAHATQ